VGRLALSTRSVPPLHRAYLPQTHVSCFVRMTAALAPALRFIRYGCGIRCADGRRIRGLCFLQRLGARVARYAYAWQHHQRHRQRLRADFG